MKKIFKSLAALALVMSAGCVKELSNDTTIAPEGNQAGQTTVVTVGLEKANTKTYLGDLVDGVRNVYWSEGDQITMNGTPSSKIDIAEGNMYATFTFDGLLNGPYKVLYPAADYVDEQTVKLPAIQEAATGTFATGSAPMAGISSNISNIHLHHLAAVIRLQVTLPAESDHAECILNRVELRGNSEEQMSGNFAINYETATLTSASNAEADKVVTTMINKELSAKATDVFVVVPAQEYAEGFSVRLIDSNGHFMDIKSKASTLAKGEIKAMPAFNFIPTGTLVGVEIRNAAELVKFAEDYYKGNYKEVSELNVKLTNHIEFDDDTNDDWAGIASIGTSVYPFNGSFDGGNYSIKGLKASAPLFYRTTSEASIQNLTIDASCTFNMDLSIVGQYVGALVGYQDGLLQNCYNNADIVISGERNGDANIGGLVGRFNSGEVRDCYMNGDVTADETVALTSVSGTDKYNISLGGLVGAVQGSARVVASNFAGNLTISGGCTNEAYVGGIAGLAGGKIESCTTSENSVILAETTSDFAGTLPTFYVGGVLGVTRDGASVERCTNNSFVHFKYPRLSSNKYAYVGGVLGGPTTNTSASVINCSNKGEVKSSSDYQYMYLGGVVGYAISDTTIDNCKNESNGNVTTVDSGSTNNGSIYLYMGGVIGRCASSSVSNISNAAKVEMGCVQSHKSTSVNVGGCIGFLETSLEGVSNGDKKSITNSGKVTATDAGTTRTYLALGGVVGTSYGKDAILNNLYNEGEVIDAVTVVHTGAFSGGIVGYVRNSATVENVVNKGKVHFANAAVLTHTNVALGGIAGGVSCLSGNNFTVSIKTSANYGEVSRVATTTNVPGSGMICGGIVGILKGANSTVENCENHGVVNNNGLNTSKFDSDFDPATAGKNGQTAGGIVGIALGAAGTEDLEPVYVTIAGCTNCANCNTARGYLGGVAGYIRNAVVSNSHNKNNTLGGSRDWARVGGIVGCISDASTITLCSVKNATVTSVQNGNIGGIAGGFAQNMSATIEESTVDATITNPSGGRAGSIVGLGYGGLTMRNCKVKGTVGTTAITSDNLLLDGNKSAAINDGCSLLE